MKSRKIFISSDFSGPRKSRRFSRKLGVLLFLFLIPSVFAIEINLKENYHPGETLIVEITGNFLDNLKAEDMLFYSGRLYTPLIYDLGKVKDKYYLYALLPDKQRNYTLIIKNAHYTEAGQEKIEDLEFDFSVSGNLSLFTVNPGFIITDRDFNIKVNAIKTISLTTEFLSASSEIEIPIEMTKTIKFSISGINKFTVTFLSLKAENTEYKIPIVIFPTETSEISLSNNLRFSTNNFNFTVLEKEDFEFPITLINTGQKNITDISINTSIDIIKIKPENIPVLEGGNSTEVIVTINSGKEESINAVITAFSGNLSSEIFLSITTTKNKEEFQEFIEEAEILEQNSCSDLQGYFCEDDEECTRNTSLAIDGLCCTGECKKTSTAGTGKIIALTVIIIFLAIIVFFVFKKLRARGQTDKEILKDKTQKYEERFRTKSQEIKNGLTRT